MTEKTRNWQMNFSDENRWLNFTPGINTKGCRMQVSLPNKILYLLILEANDRLLIEIKHEKDAYLASESLS